MPSTSSGSMARAIPSASTGPGRAAPVGHRGIHVHLAADAVPAVVLDDPVPSRPAGHTAADRVRDVAEPGAGPGGGQAVATAPARRSSISRPSAGRGRADGHGQAAASACQPSTTARSRSTPRRFRRAAAGQARDPMHDLVVDARRRSSPRTRDSQGTSRSHSAAVICSGGDGVQLGGADPGRDRGRRCSVRALATTSPAAAIAASCAAVLTCIGFCASSA